MKKIAACGERAPHRGGQRQQLHHAGGSVAGMYPTQTSSFASIKVLEGNRTVTWTVAGGQTVTQAQTEPAMLRSRTREARRGLTGVHPHGGLAIPATVTAASSAQTAAAPRETRPRGPDGNAVGGHGASTRGRSLQRANTLTTALLEGD